MIEPRELLHECDTCHQDYTARQWRRSRTFYREGVTGWICPKGHETKWCDSNYHEWQQVDEYLRVCVRCGVEDFHLSSDQ